ncbi:signal recognition particle-docking protein FtsY [Acidaminobacter sp. JC074]|uniref:signal recognition particle-docking protein FtsY n=1 Tax=Acidaminobacter sp. JC074 TaxID=2530199 RepID=UPI001F0D4F8A|nr:signal recognition particle-docking protein FtsY [Acidaminobacter sp. JC074]MCH4888332.1 signal recognition particle-docking protein FtsY [Acidaminobacter sp. JC074]
MFKKLFGKKKKEDEIIDQELELSGEEVQEDDIIIDETPEEAFEEAVEESVVEEVEEVSEASAEVIEPVEEVVETEEFVEQVIEKPKKKSFFAKLQEGLMKTQKNFTDKIDNLINNYGKIDDELLEEIEEILVMADVGMSTTMDIIEKLREELTARKITDSKDVKPVLKDVLVEMMTHEEPGLRVDNPPSIVFVIGVNGAGKTTSIGKITNLLKNDGKNVLLAAADTFRAAAIDQLKVWGDRSSVDVIAQSEGSDPAAVVYDAVHAARSRKSDVLIVDTAGRLHNKKNLMMELEKVFKVVEREYQNAEKEVLLVLDGTTGQNAIQQAKLFKEVTPISGIVLTKLDGSAKGGAVISVNHELNIPVKLIGVGEGIDDLQRFDPRAFADALLGE